MTKHVTLSSTIHEETLGEHAVRVKSLGPRRPLRTLTELAEEFGVSPRTLVMTFAHHDGPKPIYRTGSKATAKQTWYNPVEVRVWWRNHQKKKTDCHTNKTPK